MSKTPAEKKKYYVVRERAVPEVLLKVVEAKQHSSGRSRADQYQQELLLQI